MSKFLNISTDTTLGGNSASDDTVSSQKAVKAYVDSQTGTAPAFANITGQPTDNANLATALAGKVPTSRTINSKALTSDITLTASDVGALPDSTVIPTVNNATLTIQKNGTTVNTFTANASSNVTANITVPTKTSDLTNDDGFITGITSSDVTTALGYTPYNSTNPNGYQANVIETVKVNGTALTPTNKAVDITVPSEVTETTVSGWGFTKNTGTVTSVNNVSPVSGNVTLSIPAAQIQSDWTQSDNTKLDYIKNKPSLATVATTGAYSDLSGTPTIPTVNNATLTITQGGTTKGTFTANASSNVTIDLDSGGTVDVLLEALYPVGSVYITTANTCPLSTLISGSTWTLQSSGIVTSVNTNVQIKGNGKSLGLTDGTNLVGSAAGYGTSAYLNFRSAAYGGNVGTVYDGAGTPVTGKALGVTTDASKSGMIGTVTRSTLSVNIWQRTA